MADSSTTKREPNDAPQEQSQKALWYMHVAGPDDIHAVPDFWTGLAWAAELNAFIAARAEKEKWAADDNWPLTQATVRRWTWPAEQHATLLARELSERQEHAARRAAAEADTDALQADLRELLTLLGMGDHARAASPHEVFQEALAVLKKRLAPMRQENPVRLADALEAAAAKATPSRASTYRRLAAVLREPGFASGNARPGDEVRS